MAKQRVQVELAEESPLFEQGKVVVLQVGGFFYLARIEEVRLDGGLVVSDPVQLVLGQDGKPKVAPPCLGASEMGATAVLFPEAVFQPRLELVKDFDSLVKALREAMNSLPKVRGGDQPPQGGLTF